MRLGHHRERCHKPILNRLNPLFTFTSLSTVQENQYDTRTSSSHRYAFIPLGTSPKMKYKGTTYITYNMKWEMDSCTINITLCSISICDRNALIMAKVRAKAKLTKKQSQHTQLWFQIYWLQILFVHKYTSNLEQQNELLLQSERLFCWPGKKSLGKVVPRLKGRYLYVEQTGDTGENY